MVALTCSECGGRRWVRYFSETTDGNFEETFRLCSCNRKPEAGDEPACEGAQDPVIRVVCLFDLWRYYGAAPEVTTVVYRDFKPRGDGVAVRRVAVRGWM